LLVFLIFLSATFAKGIPSEVVKVKIIFSHKELEGFHKGIHEVVSPVD